MTRVEPKWEEIAKRMEEEIKQPTDKLAVRLYVELTHSMCYDKWVNETHKAIDHWKLFVLTGLANEIFHRLCKLESVYKVGETDEEHQLKTPSTPEEEEDDEAYIKHRLTYLYSKIVFNFRNVFSLHFDETWF